MNPNAVTDANAPATTATITPAVTPAITGTTLAHSTLAATNGASSHAPLAPPFTCAVVIFAKAPVPGFAKTRLMPALGAQGAADLAQALLTHAVAQALAADVGPVEICCAPDASHPAFAALAMQRPVTLTLQGDGDLGARMHRAFMRHLRAKGAALAVNTRGAGDAEALAGASDAVILIGTDAPGLSAAYLRQARDALRSNAAVFGPATDGGYTLVGLRTPQPHLFEGMTWSTPQVMHDTRVRLVQSRLQHAELAPLPDIDEPRDLVHLRSFDTLSRFASPSAQVASASTAPSSESPPTLTPPQEPFSAVFRGKTAGNIDKTCA